MKSFDTDGKFGELTLETESVCEEDWANNWKKYFKVLEIGEKITICPIWENAPETDRIVFKTIPE